MAVPRTHLEPALSELYDYMDSSDVQTDAIVASGSAVALTTATPANITSITLAAGRYNIMGVVGFLPAASTSITRLQGSESETSATQGATGKGFALSMAAVVPGAVAQEFVLPFQRLTLTQTTTIYLVATATFTVSTMGAYGTLTAVARKA